MGHADSGKKNTGFLDLDVVLVAEETERVSYSRPANGISPGVDYRSLRIAWYQSQIDLSDKATNSDHLPDGGKPASCHYAVESDACDDVLGAGVEAW